jgi:hypothetical protein
MPTKFGGGGESYIHPAVMVAMLLVAILTFILPRKQGIVPFIAGAFLIPMDQVLIIGPFHFQMLRLLILIGWARVLSLSLPSRVGLAGGFNRIDRALVVFVLSTAACVILLWQDSAAVTNQLGMIYTVFGIYFLLRYLIRDRSDIRRTFQTFAWVAAVLGVILAVEQLTGRNPYIYIGGAREVIRANLLDEGRNRAMGSFGHPILAGTFGGILVPFFIALRVEGYKKTALLGFVASTTIALSANSSTPWLAFVAGLFAFWLWPLRKQMSLIRRLLVVTLIGLHLCMKAPVWALIARVDLTGSSSGYHRYQLVDQCIRHFSDWWLVGTKDYGNWGWDMWDLANQYVSICDTSGLLPFICFIAILVYGFQYLGQARRLAECDRKTERWVWAICAALFANLIAFFGISYFDQTMAVWYCLLAIIPVVWNSVETGTVKLSAKAVRRSNSRENELAPVISPRTWGMLIKHPTWTQNT